MLDWKTDVDWAKTALVVANLNKRLGHQLRANIRRLIEAAEQARIPVIFVRTADGVAESGSPLDGTSLEPGLRAVGRESLIIAGDASERELESIMTDAFLLGFNCVVAIDGTTANGSRPNRAGSDPMSRNLAWHAETHELIAALENVAPTKPGLAEALAAC